jgi:uncharacterized protein YjeT (DUF2065 family)
MNQQTPQQNPKPVTEQQIRILRITLYSAAAFFVIGGLTCFLAPGLVQEFFGMDADTTKIFGGVLVAVGIIDCIIFPRWLDQGLRK